MKFSIVIPLYNKEKYIERTLKSVMSQTFEDWECIIVDDDSTDSSVQIVEKYLNEKIKLLHQKNMGPSAARNFGVKNSLGDWVALLDADDYWLDSHLGNLNNLINQHPECGVVCSNFLIRRNDNDQEYIHHETNINRSIVVDHLDFLISEFRELNHISSSAINNQLWVGSGGFNEKLRLGEDSEFWFRLGLKTKFALSYKASAVYFQDLSGNSTRTVLYVGDNPCARHLDKVLVHQRAKFADYIATSRMKTYALGNLISGNRVELRRLAKSSFDSSVKWKALVYYFLSFIPSLLSFWFYSIYRSYKNLPFPKLINVELKEKAR